MSEHKAFTKIHVEEKDKADLSGVLEQLNLPPAMVEYVRKNQKAIYSVIGIISAVVVIWALYDSYVENKIEKSESALSIAQKLESDERGTSLQSVIDDYAGTAAAQWAQIEIARLNIENKKYSEALQQYSAVSKSIDKSNPLFPLVTFGLAQTQESLGDFDAASISYSSLKTIKGFESIGYTGSARILEVKGEKEAAVNELEEYLGTLIGDGPESAEKLYITEKISRLKAAK